VRDDGGSCYLKKRIGYLEKHTAFTGDDGLEELLKVCAQLGNGYDEGVADGAGGLLLIMHNMRKGLDCESSR
jgi:hypothetical protein